MVTFCIKEEDNKILSNLLERIIIELYKDKNTEALFLTSYILHKPLGLDLDGSIEKDGINIRLNLVLKEDGPENYEFNYDYIKPLLKECYDKTHINVYVQVSNIKLWEKSPYETRRTNLDYVLSDGQMIFDKTDTLSKRKWGLFMLEHHYDTSVEFEPPLELQKVIKEIEVRK